MSDHFSLLFLVVGLLFCFSRRVPVPKRNYSLQESEPDISIRVGFDVSVSLHGGSPKRVDSAGSK